MDLRQMQKGREKIICALWKQLSNIVIGHIQQTELKRLHLTELQKIDGAASLTIAQQEQETSKQEQELQKLQQDYDRLFASQEEQIQQLQNGIDATTKEFFQLRKALMHDLNQDEKQLAHLTTVSNEVIKCLEAKRVRGRHLLHLAHSCQKLENQGDRMTIKELDFDDKVSNSNGKETSSSSEKSSSDKQITLPSLKIRPKTSIPKPPQMKHVRKLRSEETLKPNLEVESFTIKTRLVRNFPIKEDSITIAKKVLSKKLTKSQSRSSSSGKSIDSCSKTGLSHLNKLEGLWLVYNKVELDCIDLKKERKHLLLENQKLKEEIRTVLEASALGPSLLQLKHAGSASSKRRFAFSAPVSTSTVH